MKTFHKLTILSFLFGICQLQTGQACDIERTKSLYLQLDNNDRKARSDFLRQQEQLLALAKQQSREITEHEMLMILRVMDEIDSENQKLLDQIVGDCGWPTYEKWGATPVYAAVKVSLHAPLSFKKKYFPMVEAGYKSGEVPNWQFAQYVDKILTREGKPQRYGMQRAVSKAGMETLMEVEDPANLNNRRQAIGLTPLGGFPMPSNWLPAPPEKTGSTQ